MGGRDLANDAVERMGGHCLEPASESKLSAMRWTIRSIIVLLVLALAYAAWPFWAAYDFVTALGNRDAAGIERRVNFPAVRYSLTEQVVLAYLQLSGRDARLGQFGRSIAVAAAASIAEPVVARLISAQALMELLESDSAVAAAATSSTGVLQGLGSGSVDTVRQLLLHSDWGFRRFVLTVPVNAPRSRRFRLRFRLTSWTWKLAAVDVPEDLRNRLAQELVRLTERK
jgi:hypothetical protein